MSSIDLCSSPSKPQAMSLKIPGTARSHILPPVHLSGLLQFRKLPITTSILPPSAQDASIEDWFSAERPVEPFHIDMLKDLPMPPAELVKKLHDILMSSHLVSLASVIPLHLPEEQLSSTPIRLPLWVVEYWLEAIKAQSSHVQWAGAVRWISKHVVGSTNGRNLQKQIITMLAELRWDEKLCGDEVGYGHVRILADFLGSTKLWGHHISQMLSVLRNDVELTCLLSPHLIVDLEFQDSLIGAHGTADANIANDRRLTPFCQLEKDLLSGYKHVVSGPLFVNDNHYTFFVLDLRRQILGYGDSIGNPLPSKFQAAFEWWIARLIEQGAVTGTIKPIPEWFSTLAVTKQRSGDGVSCGILAVNGLEHFLLDRPLLSSDRFSVAHERMKHFVEVSRLHLQARTHRVVCDSEPRPEIQSVQIGNFARDAVNASFTFRSPSPALSQSSFAAISASGQSDLSPGPPSSSQLTDSALPAVSPALAKRRLRLNTPELPESPALSVSQSSPCLSDLSDRPMVKRARSSNVLSSPRSSQLEASSSSRPFSVELPESPSRLSSTATLSPRPTIPGSRQITAAVKGVAGAVKRASATITAHFPKVSKEDWREAERRRAIAEAPERARILAAEKKEAEKAAAAKREYDTIRQRKYRAMRGQKRKSPEDVDVDEDESKQVEGREGSEDKSAGTGSQRSSKKRKVRKLKAFDDTSVPDTSMVAEHSRPYRGFKKSLPRRDPLDRRGRPSGTSGEQKSEPAQRTNWQQPALWAQILDACDYVGWPWHPTAITERLQAVNKRNFAKFHPQRISDWRDETVTDKLVWKESVQRRVRNGNRVAGTVSREGILADQPKTVAAIVDTLKQLREAQVGLDLVTCRGIMIAVMQHQIPEIFEKKDARGKSFACSDSFTRRFLKRVLNWSLRRVTRAGHKIPVNAEEVCLKACYRAGTAIRDEQMRACFVVNTDQTQSIYSSGGNLTYNTKGARQVTAEGVDEKRACTMVVGVSMSGEVLPFQVIYQGSTKRSLPSPTATAMERASQLGMSFEVSHTTTYWSTQATMQTYVSNILVPYFEKHKKALDLPDQRCLWLIDVWSVHRSLKFRQWMKNKYPWIIVNYVPAGCTGLMQPCDVGIQRPMKHAMKRCAHQHTVNETLKQLEDGRKTEEVKLDKGTPALRNRSVECVVRGYEAVNDERLVRKAWEKCAAGPFNLSYESLTSREMRQALNELATSDPSFYQEITRGDSQLAPASDKPYEEDSPTVDDHEIGDDSSLSLRRVKKKTIRAPREVMPAPELSDSEDDDGVSGFDGMALVAGKVVAAAGSSETQPSLGRRSGRARVANRKYSTADWLDNDVSSSDCDE